MSASPVPSRWRSQSLVARLVAGLLLAPAAVGAVVVGGLVVAAALLAVLLVGLVEFLLMARRAGHRVMMVPAVATLSGIVLLTALDRPQLMGPFLFAAGMIFALLALRPPLEGRLQGLALSVLGTLYLAGPGIHLLWLRDLPFGTEFLLLALLGTWASDVFAFFVGVRWGRRRLAPHISPHKSVEGFLGGLLGSIVVTAVAGRLLIPEVGFAALPALLGAVIGLVAPVGDLLESTIKRNLDCKDASRVIPGHGGVLDRIDSLLLTVPMVYYVVVLLAP